MLLSVKEHLGDSEFFDSVSIYENNKVVYNSFRDSEDLDLLVSLLDKEVERTEETNNFGSSKLDIHIKKEVE